MVADEAGLSDFDEKLLQGLFARVWQHLATLDDPSVPVTQHNTPERMLRELDLSVAREGVGVEQLLSDIDEYLKRAVRTSHPHFMNPLWAGTDIPALAGEIVTALTNTSMYTFEIAPMATLIEKEMVTTMARLAGFEAGEGVFTTGGSNGNLLGLLCARDRKLPDASRSGIGGKRLVAFVSEDAHYSAAMAMNVLGIGIDNLVTVACDAFGQMRSDLLDEAVKAEIRAGNLPFCVIATAGTTVRGAIDQLPELADVCQKHKLWLHVDAAWGGAALLSPKWRGLLAGIERADSICWDPHKMMGMPLICSLFLTRDSGVLQKTCSHTSSAHYLLYEDAKDVDLGRMSLQCGRRVDAVKLWLAWRAKGNDGWRRLVERYFSLAERLASLIGEEARLELLFEPTLTNVCFRYCGDGIGAEKQDEITSAIRSQLLSEGKFMVSLSHVAGRPIIRAIISNPAIDEQSLKYFLTSIVDAGDALC